jgi:hypothetical protein
MREKQNFSIYRTKTTTTSVHCELDTLDARPSSVIDVDVACGSLPAASLFRAASTQNTMMPIITSTSSTDGTVAPIKIPLLFADLQQRTVIKLFQFVDASLRGRGGRRCGRYQVRSHRTVCWDINTKRVELDTFAATPVAREQLTHVIAL